MYANPGSNSYFNSYSSLEPEHAVKVPPTLLVMLMLCVNVVECCSAVIRLQPVKILLTAPLPTIFQLKIG